MKFSVKKLSVIALLILGTISCSDDSDDNPSYTTTFNATLVGASEIPANASTATGDATLVYDSSTKKFTITVNHNVQNPTAGHIHKGAAGVSGDAVFPFTNLTSPISYTSGALTDEQVADLFANMYYVNIHSSAFPQGEIRGQLNKLVVTPGGTGGGDIN